MSITLNQVRCFIAVAEELHFGRAAERLQMTQPPLSRQVQKLERGVGARLLERDSRGVALTPAGAAFLDDAYRMLATVEASVAHARRVEGGSSGTVHLGFTAVSAIGVLGPLLALLDRELPDVEVVLHERVTGAQVEGLRRGELDLGLARPPFDTGTVSSAVVVREPLLAAVPAGHPLASAQGPLRPEDFDGQPVIGYHPAQARYFHELSVRFLLNSQARTEQHVQQVLTALLLVAAGQGVAFVPASAAALGVAGVVHRPLVDLAATSATGDPARPVELHAIWPRDGLTPLRRRVLDLVRQAAEGDAVGA
ncbi:LysR family transcriptional regulator [Auraticoccus sp. F435]|uniref:LysR family transcriptional regulator n=1 Tax=Auraticoccus cholistanensis TaxID=2656650 RepID=A0A6A9UQE3_9ACTN|nr:LysR family transcriptional regulator [Auraticoccus cholistanensis]MVA74953.1 LysR family transcriptional regulator [Auraticoccus cholistanensis]